MEINHNYILVSIIFLIYITIFIIGYIIGKLSNKKQNSFYATNDTDVINHNIVEIDEKTIVTDIGMEGIEKKYQTLAEVKQTEENISSSINKLKNMKR